MASLFSHAMFGMLLLACTGTVFGSSNCGIQASDIQSELCEIRDKVSALEEAFSTVVKLQTDVANLWHAVQSQTTKILQHETALKTSTAAIQQVTDIQKTVDEIKNKTSSLEAKCASCTTEVDHCFSSPCKNNGSCVSLTDGYYCVCVGNYTGQHCDLFDPCIDKQPCQNGGKCFNSAIGFMCQCLQGYGGSNCEIELNPCDSQPCGHGLCAPFNNTYTCLCDTGYYGKTCNETAKQTTAKSGSSLPTTLPEGPCEKFAPCNEPSNCVNHGQDNYTCECPETQKTQNNPCIRPYYLLPYGFCCTKDICKNSDPDCFSPPSGVTSGNAATVTGTIFSSLNSATTTPSPSDTVVSMFTTNAAETQTSAQATNSANTPVSSSITSSSTPSSDSIVKQTSVLPNHSTDSTSSQVTSTSPSNSISTRTSTSVDQNTSQVESSSSKSMPYSKSTTAVPSYPTSTLSSPIVESNSSDSTTTSVPSTVSVATSGLCDNSPCNDPAQCIDGGNGNYTCVCPETLATQGDPCLVPYYLQPYGFCCSLNTCNNTGPDCSSSSPIAGSSINHSTTSVPSTVSVATSGPCNSSPCNDPAQCIDGGNGNYTCVCPETLATQGDPCLVPYYLQPYGFCCSLNTCNNTGPDCSSSSPIAGSSINHSTTSVPSTVSVATSGPCNSSPCNDPAQCIDGGNGNYTCVCPETLATQGDPCLVPYYLQPYGFCCSLNTCNNTGPDCSSSSLIAGSSINHSTTSVLSTVSVATSGPCNSSPCNDPAQCIDGANGNYTCVCPETLATQGDPCLVPYYLQPYGFCCSLNTCNNTGPDCSSSSPIAGSSINHSTTSVPSTVSVTTSGPCDSFPCNDPAQCINGGNGNYTCVCPDTLATQGDPCLVPYYLHPYGFCCSMNTCNNTGPDCSSSSPIVGSSINHGTTVATSGPCNISPCNEPAKCKDTGNGNYTCECPPTQKTLSDPCLEPYYLMPYGFCCIKDTCKNTDPDCL